MLLEDISHLFFPFCFAFMKLNTLQLKHTVSLI